MVVCDRTVSFMFCSYSDWLILLYFFAVGSEFVSTRISFGTFFGFVLVFNCCFTGLFSLGWILDRNLHYLVYVMRWGVV